MFWFSFGMGGGILKIFFNIRVSAQLMKDQLKYNQQIFEGEANIFLVLCGKQRKNAVKHKNTKSADS